jgi:hypothetical protein
VAPGGVSCSRSRSRRESRRRSHLRERPARERRPAPRGPPRSSSDARACLARTGRRACRPYRPAKARSRTRGGAHSRRLWTAPPIDAPSSLDSLPRTVPRCGEYHAGRGAANPDHRRRSPFRRMRNFAGARVTRRVAWCVPTPNRVDVSPGLGQTRATAGGRLPFGRGEQSCPSSETSWGAGGSSCSAQPPRLHAGRTCLWADRSAEARTACRGPPMARMAPIGAGVRAAVRGAAAEGAVAAPGAAAETVAEAVVGVAAGAVEAVAEAVEAVAAGVAVEAVGEVAAAVAEVAGAAAEGAAAAAEAARARAPRAATCWP